MPFRCDEGGGGDFPVIRCLPGGAVKAAGVQELSVPCCESGVAAL